MCWLLKKRISQNNNIKRLKGGWDMGGGGSCNGFYEFSAKQEYYQMIKVR